MLYYVLGSPPPLWGPGSLPAHSPSSQLVPSCSPHSLLLPLTPNGQRRVVVCYTMFRSPYHLCGGKGRAGSEGPSEAISSLGPCSPSPPLTLSCSPLPPEPPWTPGTFLGPQEALGAFGILWQPWVFSQT